MPTRMCSLAAAVLLSVPLGAAASQRRAAAVVVQASMHGVTDADSATVVRAIRNVVQADSAFRLLERPPASDTAAWRQMLHRGRLEAAEYFILADVQSVGSMTTLTLRAVNIETGTMSERLHRQLPQSPALSDTVTQTTREFLSGLFKQIK